MPNPMKSPTKRRELSPLSLFSSLWKGLVAIAAVRLKIAFDSPWAAACRRKHDEGKQCR